MRFLFLAIFSSVFSIAVFAQDSVVITLDQCKELAINSNNEIQNANLKSSIEVKEDSY